MFGYATDETEECMPLTIILAHKLNARLAELRRSGELPWLRPDSKTQVNLQGIVQQAGILQGIVQQARNQHLCFPEILNIFEGSS